MSPEFSIIVPVYNAAGYLPACLDSILAQRYGDFELILADDGSQDGCGAICDGYAARDSRVQVIHQPNRGVTAARRAALERAAGEYVCFVDGDDWVKENWLETVHGCLSESGWPDMLVFDYIQDTGRTPLPLLAEAGLYDRSRLEEEIYPHMIWDRRRPFFTQLVPGHQCTKIIRRELYASHCVRDDAVIVFEDAAAMYECLYHASSLYVCPEKLYVYRRLQSSATHRPDPDIYRKMKRSRDYMMAHLCAQAPALRGQTDAFFAEKFIYFLARETAQGDGLRQTARHLKEGLAGCELAREISLDGLPLRIKLFMRLFRARLYFAAAAVYRLRVRLYDAVHHSK